MSIQWKPEGYSSVSPYLVVDGSQRVIDFLRNVQCQGTPPHLIGLTGPSSMPRFALMTPSS